MTKLKKYDSYKNSGIDWLDKIPKHWEVKKLKYVISYKKGKNPTFFTSIPNENIYLSMDYLRNKNSEPQYIQNTKKLIKVVKDDYLLLWDGANAGEFIKAKDGFLSSTMAKIEIHSELKSFFWYYFAFIEKRLRQLTIGMGIPHVNSQVLGNLLSILPPKAEQQIAQFLDEKTSQIDQAVTQKQKLIELLKEQKQIVINDAVTKGLDPKVKLKESSVDWIGKIPKHWEVKKLKYIVDKIGDIDHYMPNSVLSGKPYLMTGDIRDKASLIDFSNCKQITDKDFLTLSKKIKPTFDDLIFARYATIGTVCYVDIEMDFLVSYSCVTIKPNKQESVGKYLFYFLKSKFFMDVINLYINSNTQGNIGIDSINKIKLALPPKLEQQQIADYLDSKIAQIDELISITQKQIEKLQEYKTVLIDNVVTGKVRVA